MPPKAPNMPDENGEDVHRTLGDGTDETITVITDSPVDETDANKPFQANPLHSFVFDRTPQEESETVPATVQGPAINPSYNAQEPD